MFVYTESETYCYRLTVLLQFSRLTTLGSAVGRSRAGSGPRALAAVGTDCPRIPLDARAETNLYGAPANEILPRSGVKEVKSGLLKALSADIGAAILGGAGRTLLQARLVRAAYRRPEALGIVAAPRHPSS